MADMKKNLKTRGRDTTGVSGRVDRGNGHDTAQPNLPWYAAQPARTGVAYALTSTGYVILTHRN
ncbi:MAG: hypothetical protein ACNA7X_06275 [Dehalococcoidia bacterium]